MTPANLKRAIRAKQREVETEHDRIEEELATLQLDYEEACAAAEPFLEIERQLDDLMTELKAPVHRLRQELAELKAKEVALAEQGQAEANAHAETG